MKDKIKTKSFWVSVAAAVVLILQTFGLKINAPYINEVIESICALMVMLGIFTAPTNSKKPKEDNKQDNSNKNDA